MNHAGNLYRIREEFAVWLTDEVNENLDEFETEILRLGSDARFVKSTTGHPQYAEARSLKIEQNYGRLGKILGFKKSEDISEQSMIESLKRRLRAIVGIEELAKLREHLVRQASTAAQNA